MLSYFSSSYDSTHREYWKCPTHKKKKAPASLIESEESSSACRRVLTPAAARCFGEVIYAEKRPPRTAGNQIQERFICVSTNQVHMYEIKRVKGYQADLRPAEDSGKIPQLSRFITSSRESSVGAVCSLLSFSDQVSDLWLLAVCVFNMLSVFSVFLSWNTRYHRLPARLLSVCRI